MQVVGRLGVTTEALCPKPFVDFVANPLAKIEFYFINFTD